MVCVVSITCMGLNAHDGQMINIVLVSQIIPDAMGWRVGLTPVSHQVNMG